MKKKVKEDSKPEEGKVYALTGGPGVPCIANGNSWKESEVPKTDNLGVPLESEDEKHFKYLDRLRESGRTNMFGAGKFLQFERGLSKQEASRVLSAWMRSFQTRHKEESL